MNVELAYLAISSGVYVPLGKSHRRRSRTESGLRLYEVDIDEPCQVIPFVNYFKNAPVMNAAKTPPFPCTPTRNAEKSKNTLYEKHYALETEPAFRFLVVSFS